MTKDFSGRQSIAGKITKICRSMLRGEWMIKYTGVKEKEEEVKKRKKKTVYLSHTSPGLISSTKSEQRELSPMGPWQASVFREFSREKGESDKLFSEPDAFHHGCPSTCIFTPFTDHTHILLSIYMVISSN